MRYWNSFILLAFISTTLQATPYVPNCPKELSTIERIQKTPSHYEIISSMPKHFLSSISFYSEHPKEGASLKPDSVTPKLSKWKFSTNHKIFIVCEYHQTGIQLTQPLKSSTTQCIVHHNPYAQSEGHFLPEKIECNTNSHN